MSAPHARTPDHPIDPQFAGRWSPRAFTGEEIPLATLMTFFEAARWAPSSMNGQPWRFVFARRGTPAFDRFLTVLAPGNQAWADRASALVALASSTHRNGRDGKPVPNGAHAFDAGAAWASFALQAHLTGWHAHAMGGFDHAAAQAALAVPEGYQFQVFIAVGRQGDASHLAEWARNAERPNDRLPLALTVREGTFDFEG